MTNNFYTVNKAQSLYSITDSQDKLDFFNVLSKNVDNCFEACVHKFYEFFFKEIKNLEQSSSLHSSFIYYSCI